jgi:hypothetical protein
MEIIAIASGIPYIGLLKLTPLRQYTTNKPIAELGKTLPIELYVLQFWR